MKDPFDNIIKKGLEAREYPFDEKDWLQAKKMLGLPRRRRLWLPLWLWGVAAGVLLLVLSVNTWIAIPDTSSYIIPSEAPLQQNRDLKAPITDSSPYEASTSDPTSPSTASSQLTNAVSTDALSQELGDKPINAISSGILKKELAITVKKSNIATTPSPPKDLNRLPSTVITTDTDNISVQSPVTTSERLLKEEHQPSSDILSQQALLDAQIGPRSTRDHHFADLSLLPMAIRPFDISAIKPIIPLMAFSKSTAYDVQSPWSVEAYLSRSLPTPQSALGLTLGRNLSSAWSANIGVGLAYFQRHDMTWQNNWISSDVNGYVIDINLFQNLGYKQLSLEIPWQIQYHINRSAILLGARANLSIWSELQQHSEFSSMPLEVIEPARSSADPEPVMITESATSVNDGRFPQLQYHVLAGYRYELTTRIIIQGQGEYLLSSPTVNLESALSPIRLTYNMENAWSMRASLFYRF